MGKITSYLTDKMGETRTKQLLAAMGGFFIFAIGNFPIADFINSLPWAGYWLTYLIILWAGFVIAISTIIILFFGKPPEYFNIKKDIKEIIEDISEEVEEETDESALVDSNFSYESIKK